MKYWRGYLVAAILAAVTWAFREFAQTHTDLVDMIYPYVTRLVQNFMAGWSGEVTFCVWQAILVALAAVGVATVVLMVIFKWNPIQWFGWVLAVVSLITMLNTGIFGMNAYAGSIADDIRLMEADCGDEAIAAAAAYYRDMANSLSAEASQGQQDLAVLNEQAVDGFENLVYHQYYSVFAGSTAPVKELDMVKQFTNRGEMGYTAAITGEAAVNPETPAVMMPFAVCREMCYRMCIVSETDKHFGAFLACQANENAAFRYAGYVMAYRYCLEVLPQSTVTQLNADANGAVLEAVESWNDFVLPAETIAAEEAEKEDMKDTTTRDVAELLTRWHYQEVVVPSTAEPEVYFDPMDETQVDLTDLLPVSRTAEAAE